MRLRVCLQLSTDAGVPVTAEFETAVPEDADTPLRNTFDAMLDGTYSQLGLQLPLLFRQLEKAPPKAPPVVAARVTATRPPHMITGGPVPASPVVRVIGEPNAPAG